ncbi:MAG TPA: hypothetical protein PKZ27_03920 [Rhodocyclaceae bacterium]|nr:hypothetical protein [Rhodocyclaceae bacterium]
MHLPRTFRSRLAGLPLLLLFAAVLPGVAADPRNSGPLELVVMVHVPPGQRLVLREAMQTDGLRQYAQWKREGLLDDYLVLFNRYVDNENWDAMVTLTFADHVAATRWKQIERTRPAGLPPAALAAASKIESAPSDLHHHRSAEGDVDPADVVYVVLPYNYLVSTAEYLQYVDTYLLPQTDGWLREGVLKSYDVHLNRYPAGRWWSSLLVLQYRNDDALGRRDAAMAKVRGDLRENNPVWKAASDSKQSIREGRQYVIAERLVP